MMMHTWWKGLRHGVLGRWEGTIISSYIALASLKIFVYFPPIFLMIVLKDLQTPPNQSLEKFDSSLPFACPSPSFQKNVRPIRLRGCRSGNCECDD